jgi:hypothetical protein
MSKYLISPGMFLESDKQQVIMMLNTHYWFSGFLKGYDLFLAKKYFPATELYKKILKKGGEGSGLIACRQFEEQACKTIDQTHQNVSAFLDVDNGKNARRGSRNGKR